jgi:hypothetical protein
MGKPEGKRQFGAPKLRWENSIRMEKYHLDWIGLVQDRERRRVFVYMAMNLRLSNNAGNFLTSQERN